jgi:hypothetical protein
MNYQVLEMKKFFLANYKLHPNAVMEYSFSPEGEDDQSKRKSTLAFVKRMNTLTTPLDDLFEEQHKLLHTLTDFHIVYNIGFSEVAFYSLSAMYAKVDKRLKEFSKTLKKHQSLPEVAAYFKNVETYLATNVYNMMKEDFLEFEKVTSVRMENDRKRFPDYHFWDAATPDMARVNQIYKESK